MGIRRLLFIAFLLLLTYQVEGQKVSLTTRPTNTFTFSSPTAAGERPSDFTNTSQSISYSSVTNVTSKITVELQSGTIPAGIGVYITAAAKYGYFWDLLMGIGVSEGQVKIDTTSPTILSNITTTRTQTRTLTLLIKITDFSQLTPGTSPITLLYTILAQ